MIWSGSIKFGPIYNLDSPSPGYHKLGLSLILKSVSQLTARPMTKPEGHSSLIFLIFEFKIKYYLKVRMSRLGSWAGLESHISSPILT